MSGFFAVLGFPIAHSLSPRIHRAFARDVGIELDYRAIEVTAERLPAVLLELADQGIRGANITLPLKQLAMVACAELSERARIAHAVNTLTRTEHGWRGDNTDGAGLLRDLADRHKLDLRGRRCLLLGAGGAAHGVAPALLEAGVDRLVVVNRNAQRADALVDALEDPARAVSRYWQDLASQGEFDLIINATSAARDGQKLDLPFSLAAPRFAAVDLNYGDAAISFLAWARTAQADQALDGLGMLVEQAAEAFEQWHGRRPDTDPVYQQLRAGERSLHGDD
jgi:shikimate dehydrogenase